MGINNENISINYQLIVKIQRNLNYYFNFVWVNWIELDFFLLNNNYFKIKKSIKSSIKKVNLIILLLIYPHFILSPRTSVIY